LENGGKEEKQRKSGGYSSIEEKGCICAYKTKTDNSIHGYDFK